MQIPDAPYIRDAERYGTDFMYSYVYGHDIEEDENDGDESEGENDEI